MYQQFHLTIATPGRSLINITPQTVQCVDQSNVKIGLCHIFLHHTSASLLLCENFDPAVQSDLEAFMSKLVPDGDALFQHIAEGPDDMPAHVRTILTSSFLMVPITNSKLALGTWQGLYLWEHRLRPYERKITITIQG